MTALIAGLVFLTVFGLVLAFYFGYEDLKQARKDQLIRSLTVGRRRGDRMPEEEAVRQETRFLTMLLTRVDLSGLETLIQSAWAGLSLERFFLVSVCCGFVFMLLPLLLFGNAVLSFLAFAAGLCLPLGVLMIRRARREEKLVAQLPDAIDTIVRSLKVGQSVDAATLEVARGFPPPIGADFRAINEEMAMGLPFETVIKNFQRRYPRLPDVRILCATFVIQRETGGKLTDILAGLASTIRARLHFQRRVRASTAEGRTTAFILGILPLGFAAVTWLLRPEYMRVFRDHPLGRKLLVVVILMEAAGFLVMRAMLRVKV
ncbi:type II secretion system F family protein [Desulfobacca acetoxidans]|uniref:Type II secretion system F domain protein n=1 Tax=Desulfobacca acetoxidans (strain ATCC 700848 / DSM 11109 / ASRB2) TaxID=880072 RepID=F2NFA9_DESAR|nr:type II secretion system F family protein [Desulfobacca acetoxidans]AEB08664.1 Type II secretion system F domain protein [Desulfobacca acetoxidans DSM 11109]